MDKDLKSRGNEIQVGKDLFELHDTWYLFESRNF